ncbi:hypothetical protein C8J56DRAFT_919767 [Mycena floridula]|nr:hypothetical protein C8J56DRAFT_919767 [Mycena floridula]
MGEPRSRKMTFTLFLLSAWTLPLESPLQALIPETAGSKLIRGHSRGVLPSGKMIWCRLGFDSLFEERTKWLPRTGLRQASSLFQVVAAAAARLTRINAPQKFHTPLAHLLGWFSRHP